MIQFPLSYPLTLTFKFFVLAPQFSVRDANGQTQAWIKQKLFKLKESVSVFADEAQSRLLYKIDADRVLDIGARYRFTDATGKSVGSVKRQGMKSLWRAHYDIADGDSGGMRMLENPGVSFSIREENPWVKVIDGLIGEIPILGFLSGLIFHPSYLVSRADGAVVMRMRKQPSLLEGRFLVEKEMPVSQGEEERILLSLMMFLLLERERG